MSDNLVISGIVPSGTVASGVVASGIVPGVLLTALRNFLIAQGEQEVPINVVRVSYDDRGGASFIYYEVGREPKGVADVDHPTDAEIDNPGYYKAKIGEGQKGSLKALDKCYGSDTFQLVMVFSRVEGIGTTATGRGRLLGYKTTLKKR